MNEVQEKTWTDCSVGTTAVFEIVITEKMVQDFAAVSGDLNPLHVDANYAATTPFGARVAHGMLGGALISRLLGTQLPGKTCVYLSQTLFFRKPIFLGTAVKVVGTVTQQLESLQALKIKTEIKVVDTGEILLDGEALVKVL